MPMFGRGFSAGIKFPQIDATMPSTTPVDPSPATAKPGFFARDGLGVSLLGNIADGMLALNGVRPTYGPAMDARRDRQYQIEDYQRRRADDLADFNTRQAVAAAQPKFFENEAGDYVRYDPSTNASSVVYDGPAKPVTPTALEQQITLYRRLNPGATDTQVSEIVKRGIAGAQYDPGVYKPMVDYKAEAARVTKATPTYANLHPKASSSGSSKATATRVVGGKAYYKIGGAWYDNAEGR